MNTTRPATGSGSVAGGLKELQPTGFSASSTDARHSGASALTTARGFSDTRTQSADTVLVTQGDAGGGWIEADLGANADQVDFVDLAPASLSAWAIGAAQLNGAQLKYANDAPGGTMARAVRRPPGARPIPSALAFAAALSFWARRLRRQPRR